MKLFIFENRWRYNVNNVVYTGAMDKCTHKDLEMVLGMRLSRESANDIAQR